MKIFRIAILAFFILYGKSVFCQTYSLVTDTTWASFDGASATPATDWNTNVATNYAVTNIGWNTTSISGAGAQQVTQHHVLHRGR